MEAPLLRASIRVSAGSVTRRATIACISDERSREREQTDCEHDERAVQ